MRELLHILDRYCELLDLDPVVADASGVVTLCLDAGLLVCAEEADNGQFTLFGSPGYASSVVMRELLEDLEDTEFEEGVGASRVALRVVTWTAAEASWCAELD